MTLRRRLYAAAVALLLIAFAAQCLAFAWANGQTYDEGVNLVAGLRILETHYDHVNLEHPPLAKLIVALPVWLFSSPRLDVAAWEARRESAFGLGRDLLYSSGVSHEHLLWLGRAPVMLLALALVALTALFAHRLWGPRAGLLALALAAFDPNLVAHGSLIGLDLPLTFFFVAALFCLNEFLSSRKVAFLIGASVAAGLALATKHSAPLLLCALGGVLFFRALENGDLPPWWDPRTRGATRFRALIHAGGNALLLVGFALVIVRLAAGRAGWEAYLVGLKAQLIHHGGGHPAFLLGEYSRTGWASYFPIALLIKLPPVSLALGLVSLALGRRGAPFGAAWTVVVVPLAIVFVGLLFTRINIGVRYALPLMPLWIIAASRVVTIAVPSWCRVALGLGLAHQAVAALRVAPHDIAFFSDLVGGPANGHRYLADSNLDWGQDVRTLGRWLGQVERPRRLYLAYFGTADPRAYGVSYWPAPSSCPHPAPWRAEPEPSVGRELLAVSVMNLQGVFFDDHAAYAWLAERRPLAELGHSIFVYDITDDAAAHQALARMYERYGPSELVAEQRERARALELRPQ